MKSQRASSSAPSRATHHLGKYRLVATLGQGGMGTVYLALASGLGQFRKLLVVKELRQDLTQVDGFVSMFLDEARLTARLDHPNVVQTFEASQEGERYFLAMEYLDGQPLSGLIERLAQSHGLPLWVHIQILCEVLSGLHYAHELTDYDGSLLHVVHRDVSPQNVFLTYHGQVKVVDFGVAKAADGSALTEPGVFKGKFAYAAPEQLLGRPVDARTDVFAVGIMLWEAIAGQRYSEQVVTPANFRARASGKERRISDVAPMVDQLLADICDKALALKPEDRFESAAAFRDDLQEFLLLSGVRVESPEIGQFMRDAFVKERRDMHLVVEHAMNNSGLSPSSVEPLPFMQGESDKVATTVADLSNLVDISLESDDAKIRESYAHSKITPLLPGRQQAVSLPPPPMAAPPPPRLMIASLALFGVCLVAVLTVMFTHSTPAEPRAIQLAPAPSAAPAALALTVKAPAPAAADPAVLPIEGAPATPEAAPSIEAQLRAVTKLRRPAPAAVRRDPRARPGTLDTAPAADVGRAKLAPSKAADAAEPSMGSDLRRTRRAPDVRIDMEDPYR